AAIVPDGSGELLLSGTVRPHGPQVEIPGSERRVDDVAGLPVDCGFGVITGRFGQALLDFSFVGRQKDVVAGEDSPDISFAAVGWRWAGPGGEVARGVDDVLVIGREIGAGRAAFASGNQMLVRAVGIHDEDLVAVVGRASGLEDETFSVG